MIDASFAGVVALLRVVTTSPLPKTSFMIPFDFPNLLRKPAIASEHFCTPKTNEMVFDVSIVYLKLIAN